MMWLTPLVTFFLGSPVVKSLDTVDTEAAGEGWDCGGVGRRSC